MSSQNARDLPADVVEIGRAIARDQGLRVRRVASAWPSRSTSSISLAAAPARSRSAARSRDRSPRRRAWTAVVGRRAPRVAPACRCGREFAPVAGPVVCSPPISAKATRLPKSALHGLRASSAPRVSNRPSVTMNGAARGARRPEHPFGVGRDRQAARPPGACCAIFRRDILTESSSGTNCRSSSAMPCALCSKRQ